MEAFRTQVGHYMTGVHRKARQTSVPITILATVHLFDCRDAPCDHVFGWRCKFCEWIEDGWNDVTPLNLSCGSEPGECHV